MLDDWRRGVKIVKNCVTSFMDDPLLRTESTRQMPKLSEWPTSRPQRFWSSYAWLGCRMLIRVLCTNIWKKFWIPIFSWRITFGHFSDNNLTRNCIKGPLSVLLFRVARSKKLKWPSFKEGQILKNEKRPSKGTLLLLRFPFGSCQSEIKELFNWFFKAIVKWRIERVFVSFVVITSESVLNL